MEKKTEKKKTVKTNTSKTSTQNNKKKSTTKNAVKTQPKQVKKVTVEKKKETVTPKEVKKVEAKKENKFIKAITTLDEKRKVIYSFIIGLLLGLLILVLVWPDRIAELKDGTQPVVTFGKTTITADELYSDMKDFYSVNTLLDKVDNIILEKKYPENEEMTESVEENAQYYLKLYKENYSYTEEQFLQANGFKDYKAFIDYLTLDYRRNKYVDSYLESKISDNDIQKYYDENVFGDINCKHILVSTQDGSTSDDDAKALAKEIIKKLNDGATFDEVKKEYSDKITYEDLGYQAWNSDLETDFITALKNLKNDSYSTEPVKTSYGYHVIYRIDQKDKPTLKKSKNNIIEAIKKDKKAADTNITYKALIQMRKDAGLTFVDSGLKSKYKTYKKTYE